MRHASTVIAILAIAAACSEDASRVANPVNQQPATPLTPGGRGPTVQVDPAGNPIPSPSDVVLLDTRTTLQNSTSLAQAFALFPGNDHSAPRTTQGGTGWSFVTNFDGAGTHALRADWRGSASVCIAQSVRIGAHLPTPHPTQLYVQWHQLLGRTASDSGANGIAGSFAVTNSVCPGQGRRELRVFRDGVTGATDAIDHLWVGSPLAQPRLQTSAGRISGNQGLTFAPETTAGRAVTITVFLQAASASGAQDGIVRMWVDGQTYIDRSDVALGAEAFSLLRFPTSFGGPPQSEAEYFWNILVWQPGTSSAPPPPAPVSSVSVALAASSVQTGQTTTATVALRDSAGNTLSGRSISWTSSNTSVATIASSGADTATISAAAVGTADIIATSEGVSGRATLTVTSSPTPTAASVTVSPSSLSLQAGGTGSLTVTVRDGSGNVITRPITWQSSNASVAALSNTTNAGATVTGSSAGSSTITATADGVHGSANVTVTAPPPPPPPPPGIPAPGSGSTIFIDMRQSLQQAATIDQAFKLFGIVDHTPYRSAPGQSGWSFTTNADGNGLHAFRADWANDPNNPDQGIRVIDYLPTPTTDLYVQWKGRIGRYPTDPDGNGAVNSYPTFATGNSLTACKRALFGNGSGDRLDYVLHRSNPEIPDFEIGAQNYVRYGDAKVWNFDSEIGAPPYTTTVHVRSATATGANDGVAQLWINGTLVLDQHDVPETTNPWTDWSFPTTCTNMTAAASEYFWDLLVWKP